MGFHNTPSNRNFIVVIAAIVVFIVLIVVFWVSQCVAVTEMAEEIEADAQRSITFDQEIYES